MEFRDELSFLHSINNDFFYLSFATSSKKQVSGLAKDNIKKKIFDGIVIYENTGLLK